MPLYPDQEVMILNFDHYFELFEKKGLKHIRLRRTKNFKDAKGVELTVSREHVWSTGDNLRKLSYKYYQTFDYWWIIGFVNKKPTDAHFNFGDEVLIPDQPNQIVRALRA